MFETFVITLRETLEATLIIGILLAYLKKTKNFQENKFVWYGVGAGIITSIIVAYIFEHFFGGFTGRAEQLYEGITMLIAAALITWMVVWLFSQSKKIKKNLESKMETHITDKHYLGIFLLSFVNIAREGTETVIFLQATALNKKAPEMISGALIGIFLAIGIGYLIFRGVRFFKLKTFFLITGIMLLIFATDLLMTGLHELEEAHLFG